MVAFRMRYFLFAGAATLAVGFALTGAASSLRAAPASSSAAPRWTSTGPEGGWIGQIEIHPARPRVVYAYGGPAGLFRSADGGSTWQRRPGPHSTWPSDTIGNLALDPRNADVVYLGTADSGVHRTTNAGASWERIDLPGPPSGQVTPWFVVVSPASPATVYVLGQGGGRAWTWSSTDAGASWTSPVELASGGYQIAGLVADPHDPATVYARVWMKGVFRSSDGAETWARASAGLPTKRLSSLAADPHRRDVLYAGTEDGTVYRSRDSATTWTVVGSGLDGDVTEISASAAGAVYLGTEPRWKGRPPGGGRVYRSASGAAPWTLRSTGLTGSAVEALASDPWTPARILAATEHGVFVTRDRGVSWVESIDGLIASSVIGLAVGPDQPQVAYAAVERGVAATQDGGRTWRLAWDARPTRASVGPLLALPGKPATVYAVTTSYTGPKPTSLLRSRDGGRTWTVAGALPGYVARLVAHPLHPETLYATQVAYASDRGRPGFLLSEDGGASWTRIGTRTWSRPVVALALDLQRPQVVYAAVDPVRWPKRSPLFKSVDGGRTWSNLPGLGGMRVATILVDPHRSDTVYAVQYGYVSDVRVSTNGGRTWGKLGRSPMSTTTLLCDPARPGITYVGTQNDGVYVHRRGDPEWQRLGLRGAAVRWLATDRRARRLYAGTAGRGVAALRLTAAER